MQKNHTLASNALRAALVTGVLGAAFVAPAAYAQDKAPATESPPTENVGLSAKVLGEIPLKDEFAEVRSRALRMRVLTIEPGLGDARRERLELVLRHRGEVDPRDQGLAEGRLHRELAEAECQRRDRKGERARHEAGSQNRFCAHAFPSPIKPKLT